MATIPLPALQIKQQPSLVEQYQSVQNILGGRQEQQLRSLQIQQAQQDQADQKATTDAMRNWYGKDYTQLPGLVLSNGGSAKAALNVSQHIQTLRSQASEIAAKDAETNSKNLDTITKQHDSYRGRLQSILDAPDEQKQSLWQQEIATEKAAGTQLPPEITDQYPGDDVARTYANHFALGSVLAKEATERTTADARAQQARTAAAQFAAKTDPSSPLYDPSAAYLAKKAAAGDADAKTILAQQAKQAGAKAGAEAAAKFPWEQKLEQMRQGGTPVYAFDPKQNATVLTTKEEAQQGGMQAIRKVGEGDIAKDTQTARQLGDAQLNVSAYRAASQKMDELDGTDIRNVSRLIGSQEFKAQFLGAELPMDWANQLAKSDAWESLPRDAKEAVASYIGARGAIIAYTKAISGTGRLTESQLKTEMANLPDPTTPSEVREIQFQRFQRNIDQVASGLPKLPGVESPASIRQRIEKQAAGEQATRQAVAQREAETHGQYQNAQGLPMKLGQEAYVAKRYIGTVSKIYADGSYDVKPD
jgi:hypothetical protein